MKSVPKPPPVPMVLDNREEWFALAFDALDTLIFRGRPFTSDDLRDLVPVPRHPNWAGTAFTAYHRKGFIRPVGFVLSRAKSRRNGIVREWVGA